MAKIKISVVAPIYNEEGNVETFYKRTKATLEGLGEGYEIILINDGSRDQSPFLLAQIAAKDSTVKVINFARNFGHQLAVTAGIDYASGECVVVIDSDLQDPPELINELYGKWQEGYEVVNARRRSRKDTFMKAFTAKMFYKGLNSVLKNPIPENVGDYRLMDRRAVDVFKSMKERDRYVRGMTTWIGFKQTFVDFDRDERLSGTTHYPFKKMFALALNAVFSFSDLPVKLAGYLTVLLTLLAGLVAVYVLYSVISGDVVHGWASQLLVTVIFGAVQMFVLSIISEYAGRIYRETQNRPLYIVSDTINF